MTDDLVTKDRDIIEITEEEQKLFDKSVQTCSTVEGRIKTIKHVFETYVAQMGHTRMTIYETLRLVAHPCVGKIEISDEEALNKLNELKDELKLNEPEWWKTASMEDEEQDVDSV